MPRTALIVGAGIGGLAAGIALRREGWAIRIVERAESARELGFGLLVSPNAVNALRHLGVADAVLRRGWAPTRCEVRRLDGRVLKRVTFPPPDVLGGPMIVALRSALHGALLDAIDPATIELGREAVGCAVEDSRARLHLADGETIDADLLVGADGIGSIIRRTLHPAEAPPRASGIVAVRGGVHGLVDRLGGLSGIYYLSRGVEAFAVRASETGIYWALSLARVLVPDTMRDPRAIVTLMAPRLDPALRAIAGATDDLRCDDLVDRDPLPAWGRGRVTLLGDAAHPLLPHTGQGAAQAMVDAVTLAAALHAGPSVERALRAYEHERQPKTAALVGQGRRTAAVMRTVNPLACAIRDAALRLMPVESGVKLFARLNRRAGTT
jgi:2-polyprenyl-6-methoxyphenol hydroxylase-like FAD-dependent oxidoreductase